jgi:hypothetical protein
MPKTVVGLFKNSGLVDDVVREIEALGLPRQEIRTLKEPMTFEVTGVMSFPRIDFEVQMSRELRKIGATETESQIYVDGLRRGGALVFATGSDEKVRSAGEVMNSHGAVEVEEVEGAEPHMPGVNHPNLTPMRDGPMVAGRISQSGGGPRCFVW